MIFVGEGYDLQQDPAGQFYTTATVEYRTLMRVEEGSLSRTLAFDCGHGYAHEESSIKMDV